MLLRQPDLIGLRQRADADNEAQRPAVLRTSLGNALHEKNLARWCRPTQGTKHDALHAQAIALWPQRAIVNVDLPIAGRWRRLLEAAAYGIVTELPAYTRHLGGVRGSDKRAPYEVVLVAERSTQ